MKHVDLSVERRQMTSQGEMTKEVIDQEIEVAMVTDLQENQTAEGRAVQKLLENQVSSCYCQQTCLQISLWAITCRVFVDTSKILILEEV